MSGDTAALHKKDEDKWLSGWVYVALWGVEWVVEKRFGCGEKILI